MIGDNIPKNFVTNIELYSGLSDTDKANVLSLVLRSIRTERNISDEQELYLGDPCSEYGVIPYNSDVNFLGVYSKE
jgi:hypothetical protein